MKAQPISLALQGGGAHGAFTWGVLDYLLEEGSLDLKAITATSAGAMNAVALAAGYAEGGHDGARELLEAFWRDVSERGAPLAAANTCSCSSLAVICCWSCPIASTRFLTISLLRL